MKTIALVAQKGGVGKSTIAVHLAVCASRKGQVVALIDLDPQASVAAWGERRTAEDVAVERATVQELAGLLANARAQGADLVVVDTAGRADETARQVMEAADIVLVPCRPFINDVQASQATADMVRRAGAPKAAFVLNAVPVQGSRHVEAREALERLMDVAPVELHQYMAFGDALNDGRSVEELEPKGKAAHEIRALHEWVLTV